MMRTLERIEAVRRKDTKSRVQGLAGRVHVLKNESEEHFYRLLDSYTRIYNPANHVERRLVLEIVSAQWRLQRCWTIETALLDHQMNLITDTDEATRLMLAFTNLADNSRVLSGLQRYELHLRRMSERATADLLRLQKVGQAVPPPKLQNEPDDLLPPAA
jgi:hypothetical protein